MGGTMTQTMYLVGKFVLVGFVGKTVGENSVYAKYWLTKGFQSAILEVLFTLMFQKIIRKYVWPVENVNL